MKPLFALCYCFIVQFSLAQSATNIPQTVPMIDSINIAAIPNHTIQTYWLSMIEDGLSQPVAIPVLIAKGSSDHPVLGMTAALHGNELNGIPVIQRLFDQLDINNLTGTIIAIPGLNPVSITDHRRRYVDEEDLNRNFPGKANGNRSQQFVWQINQKILTKIDYLIDMHTASFGRVNTLYIRADFTDETNKKMALLMDADIVLQNKGVPSADDKMAATRTMRAEAMLKGVPTITVELGNPQVYQEDMIQRGVRGVANIMSWLKMVPQAPQSFDPAAICKKSYWTYLDKGGYLEIPLALNQRVKKGDTMGILRNPFGQIIKTYYCPEDGIVIGKSSNPVNMTGGRIIHLGILE